MVHREHGSTVCVVITRTDVNLVPASDDSAVAVVPGAFNSWGRQPYFTDVPPVPSAEPLYSRLHNNYIVANYAADGGCYDNDDGSSWYMGQPSLPDVRP